MPTFNLPNVHLHKFLNYMSGILSHETRYIPTNGHN